MCKSSQSESLLSWEGSKSFQRSPDSNSKAIMKKVSVLISCGFILAQASKTSIGIPLANPSLGWVNPIVIAKLLDTDWTSVIAAIGEDIAIECKVKNLKGSQVKVEYVHG